MSVIIVVFLTGVLALFSVFYSQGKWAGSIGIIGLLVALGLSFFPESLFWQSYQKMFWYDGETALFTKIILAVSVLIFSLGNFSLYHHRKHQPEIYALVLFSLCGGLLLLGFQNFMVLFLGIEILSIPLYVLVGSEKANLRSVEASIKYFLMGAFATGFLLFGMALVYGSAGSLDLLNIGKYSMMNGEDRMFILGIIFILGALAFKVAMAPFHLWSPDVYYGSPTWITLFMASVVKIAGFYAFFKLMTMAFGGNRVDWQPILWSMISLTLLLGSVLGLVQNDVKKMLAYSSMANVGYLGLIFFGTDGDSVGTLAFYLLAYSWATLGVFMGMIWVEKCKKETSYEAFQGLAKSQPLLALVMTVSLFSMAGIPFTAGFMGKLGLFLQAMEETIFLIILAVLSSVVSVAYYLRLIMAMYFKEKDAPFDQKFNLLHRCIAIFIILIILIMGISGNRILG